MEVNHLLLGCINAIQVGGLIRTRFFYIEFTKDVNGGILDSKVEDVTESLCESIAAYNSQAEDISISTGEYVVKIPYSFNKSKLAIYSHGYGLSNYLEEDKFNVISVLGQKDLTFPLMKCRLKMLAPADLKMHFGMQYVFHQDIEKYIKRKLHAIAY